MIERLSNLAQVAALFRSHPAVAILGPRQCGKTTLAQDYLAGHVDGPAHYFDLEDPEHLNRLADAKLALEPLTGLIVIDEVQRAPELFPLLRVLIDRHRARQRYLILGSASRDLIRQSSETLAGRIAYLELSPFTAFEAGDVFRLWLRWPRIGKPGASRITWRRWWPAPRTRKSPARWTLSEEAKGGGDSGEPLYDEAVAFVVESRRASISAVQRKLRIGYNRAARLIEAMEEAGVVSAMNSQRGP